MKSPESQTLLKNIRTETTKTLELLELLRAELFAHIIIVDGKNNHFSFNTKTGSTTLNDTTVVFPPGQQKYLVLKTIVLSEEMQGSYDDVSEALGITRSKPNNRKIQDIMKDIKEDLEILPVGSNKNEDIFINLPSEAYRIHAT